MSWRRNIIANYLGAGAMILAPILALPWYLAQLGSKQYGLIGFVATLQVVLGLIDAGISQALVRDFATRFDTSFDGKKKSAILLFSFERVYWLFSLSVGLGTWLASRFIAEHWLNLDGLPLSSGVMAVGGAAFIFAAQFPGSIYRSFLVGSESQVALNANLFVFALLRHAGGVFVVLIWPTLGAFLVWQIVIALAETLGRAWMAWRIVETKRSQLTWSSVDFKKIWFTAAGMTGATLLGALTVQMDRILLSRAVSIEQFGYYTIAATLAVGSMQLINPLTQAVLPQAIKTAHDPLALYRLSVHLAKMIFAVVFACGVIFVIAGEWLLFFWLKQSEAVGIIYEILKISLIGTILNAFYNVGYVNWLSGGKTEKILKVNLFSFIFSILTMPFFISQFGVKGAALGWVVINLTGFVWSLEWLSLKFRASR